MPLTTNLRIAPQVIGIPKLIIRTIFGYSTNFPYSNTGTECDNITAIYNNKNTSVGINFTSIGEKQDFIDKDVNNTPIAVSFVYNSIFALDAEIY